MTHCAGVDRPRLDKRGLRSFKTALQASFLSLCDGQFMIVSQQLLSLAAFAFSYYNNYETISLMRSTAFWLVRAHIPDVSAHVKYSFIISVQMFIQKQIFYIFFNHVTHRRYCYLVV